MEYKHIIRALTIALALLFTSSLCNAQQRKIDWKRDLDSLAVWLPQKHYNMFLYRDKTFFNNGIEELKNEVDSCSKLDKLLRLQQFIVKFGDAHTNVNYMEEISSNRIYPLGLECFGDDYYIISTTKKYKHLLGKRLTKINDFPIRLVEKLFSSLIVVDSRSSIYNTMPNLLSLAEVYKFFKIAQNYSIKISYDDNGRERSSIIQASPINTNLITSVRPQKFAMHIANKDILFNDTYLTNDKIYYIQYNKCWNRELEERYGKKERAAAMPSFVEFSERILKTIDEKDIKKLVFDLRYNAGGNSRPFTELVKQIAAKLKDRKDIKCYAVIGRRTFSSGILNSLDLKNNLNATFVGEETSGCANHLGEIRGLRLPESNAEISYSTKYFKDPEFSDGPLRPDVVQQTSYIDYIRGTDPVLEWIKIQ